MRSGEAVSEGICDRGCWTAGTTSRGKKTQTDENPLKQTLRKKNQHQVEQLVNGFNRFVNHVMNTAPTSYGEVCIPAQNDEVPPQGDNK